MLIFPFSKMVAGGNDHSRTIRCFTEVKSTNRTSTIEDQVFPIFEWKVSLSEINHRKFYNMESYVEKVEFHLHPTFPEPIRGTPLYKE